VDVFVNCPFDEHYSPIADAIIFAIVDSGFSPRSALERSDASEVRIGKIYELISQSQYAIHDLSRNTSNDQKARSRFNMPLELGIFLGAKSFGGETHNGKRCLIFDRHPHNYQAYISDISGQDIYAHNDNAQAAVRSVRDWLSMLPEARTLPSASVMYERYLRFRNELSLLCYDRLQRIDELTFSEYVTHASEFCKDKQDTLTSGLPQPWGEALKDPHLPIIRAALESLKCVPDSYLILSKAGIGTTHIQAIKTSKDSYHVEVQEGDRDRSSKLVAHDLRTVIDLFYKFREWDQSYRDIPGWEGNDWHRGVGG
jgi:hypothetical protein